MGFNGSEVECGLLTQVVHIRLFELKVENSHIMQRGLLTHFGELMFVGISWNYPAGHYYGD